MKGESFVVDRVVLVFFFYLRFHHNIARTQGHLYPKGATVIKILIYHINYGVV